MVLQVSRPAFISCVSVVQRQSRLPFHRRRAGLHYVTQLQSFSAYGVGLPSEVSPLSRLHLSSSSSSSAAPAAPAEPWSRIFANGVTPYTGVVSAKGHYGTIVTLDAGYNGLIPKGTAPSFAEVDAGAWDVNSLSRGDRVTVYVYRKNKDTGKIMLALRPLEVHVRPAKSMVVDGRHPYAGVVASKAPFGFFVDIGFERHAFVPMNSLTSSTQDVQHDDDSRDDATSAAVTVEYNPGDSVTVYLTRHDPKTGKLTAAVKPRTAALLLWKDMIADGQTPHAGNVQGFCGDYAIVDIGCESPGLLELSSSNMLQKGMDVSVYIIGRERRQLRIFLALQPLPRPLLQWDDVIADGQTPYAATLAAKLSCGHHLVDMGCEAQGMLLSDDAALQGGSLEKGAPLTVFVVKKRRSTFRFTLTTVRRPRPIQPYSAVVADGITPHTGVVTTVTAHGIFVDLGCDVPGLLPRGYEQSPLQCTKTQHQALHLTEGMQVTVYVWYKPYGKLHLALQPRSSKAVSLLDLRADGVTPLVGTVIAQRDAGAQVDIACESLGLLSCWDNDTDAATIQRLQPGDTVQVYVRGRNVVTGKVNLSLEPTAAPLMQATEVLGGGQMAYHGTVVTVNRGVAFVSFGCEVTGVLPESTDACPYRLQQQSNPDRSSDVVLQQGDHLLVRPWNYDSASGRWTLSCDGYAEHTQSHAKSTPLTEQELASNIDLVRSPAQNKAGIGTVQLAQPHLLYHANVAGIQNLSRSQDAQEQNWKSILQHHVQADMQRSVVKGDIVYEACFLQSCWIAYVQVPAVADLNESFVFSGEVCSQRSGAEQSAAKAAVESLQQAIRRE